jgi:hypothetical protein
MITRKTTNGTLEVIGVLATFETYGREERVMSDVWDWVRHARYLTADGKIADVTYFESAEVDATEEVRTAVKALADAAGLESEARSLEGAARDARAGLERADVKGRTVKVTAKRAKGLGNEGPVTWVGRCNFSGKARVGMRLATGEVFYTNASNCTVTGLEASETADVAALEARAEEAAALAAVKGLEARALAVKAVESLNEVAPF